MKKRLFFILLLLSIALILLFPSQHGAVRLPTAWNFIEPQLDILEAKWLLFALGMAFKKPVKDKKPKIVIDREFDEKKKQIEVVAERLERHETGRRHFLRAAVAVPLVGGGLGFLWWISKYYNSLAGQPEDPPERAVAQYLSPDQAASYVIFIDSDDENKIKARNGATGQIEFSGTDAATTINNAINALSNGGMVLIRAGAYIINSTIQLNHHGVQLVGEGFSTYLLLNNNSNTHILKINDNCTRCVITDLRINGNWGNNATGHGIIVGTNANHCTIQRVYMENIPQMGIYGDGGGSKLTISHVILSGAKTRGIYLLNWHSDTSIEYCSLGNGRELGHPQMTDDVIYLGNYCSHMYIVGVDVFGGKFGINVVNSRDIVIVASNAHVNGGYGFWLQGTDTRNCIVANNVVYESDQDNLGWGAGVVVSDGAHDNLIVNNILTNIGGWPPPYTNNSQKYGVLESGSGTDYNTIIGNNVRGNAIAGISKVGSHTILKSGIGYVSENKGTATISNGNSSVNVSHGLAGTPSIVIVTGHHSELADAIVTAKSSRTFTVTVPSNVTANRTFDWYAQI